MYKTDRPFAVLNNKTSEYTIYLIILSAFNSYKISASRKNDRYRG